MLSIQGTTYSEVFLKLAYHKLLGSEERTAAEQIGLWLDEQNQLISAAFDADSDSERRSAREVLDRHNQSRPYCEPSCDNGRRDFVMNGICFQVWQDITGHTMNVDVDRR